MSRNRMQYVRVRRSDRLHPSLLSTRRQALRQLARILREMAASADLPPGINLVDFGCAERPYEELFRSKFIHYLAADLPGNPHADLTIGREGHLPLDDACADCVLSSQVLEHVAWPSQYLAEARRVLRPTGRLLLSTHGSWPYHPDPADYRRWTLPGLRHELDCAGFKPIQERAVLGDLATALQLLQDAATAWLPPATRIVPGLLMQGMIGVVELFRRDQLPSNAAVYVILAVPK